MLANGDCMKSSGTLPLLVAYLPLSRPVMRVFLITLAMSMGLTLAFWSFGLAHRIWPTHPLLLTSLVAAVCAIAVQTFLGRDDAAQKQK